MGTMRLLSRMLPLLYVASLACAGEEVTIQMKQGSRFKAEILLVRDSMMVVSRRPGLSVDSLAADPTPLLILPFSLIEHVAVRTGAHTWKGIGIGAATGAAAGTAVVIGGLLWSGSTSSDPPMGVFWRGVGETALGAALGGLVGGAIGGWIGAADGLNLDPSDSSEARKLQSFSRFTGSEPEVREAWR